MLNRNITKSLVNKTVFITGNTKNAGKTTFLNYLLTLIRKETLSLAYLTIGIDGELNDIVFGNSKPSVNAVKGDLIVTTDNAVSVSDGMFEIMEVFPFKTKLGTVILAKVIRGGAVELIGPENNVQLSYILKSLKEEKNIKTVFVDGAVNRITQVSSIPDSVFIYVMSIYAKDLVKSINSIKTLSLIKDFPVFNEDDPECAECFVCDGALTTLKLQKIPERYRTVLVSDFTKIFLTWNELNDFLKKRKIFCREKFKLSCIAVNLYDIERNEFEEILKKNKLVEHIIFNPYQVFYRKTQ